MMRRVEADIEIPEIEIAEGWPVEDLETEQDCEDAYCYLMSAVATIEHELELAELDQYARPGRDRRWAASAKAALKYRKAALQLVNNRRRKIGDAQKKAYQERVDRLLVQGLKKKISPQDFDAVVKAVLMEADTAVAA